MNGAILGAICYTIGWYHNLFGSFPRNRMTILCAIPTLVNFMTGAGLIFITIFTAFLITK